MRTGSGAKSSSTSRRRSASRCARSRKKGSLPARESIQASAFGAPNLHALLLPDPFTADNEVTAYLVDGEPGAETLRPLQVAGA